MKKLKLLIIAFLIVIIGVFTFMKGAFRRPVLKDGPMTISTSDVKNPATAGTEIRIKSILVNDMEVVPQMTLSDEWKMDGDLLVCYANDGLKHITSIFLSKITSIVITFIGQKGSGNAVVCFDGQESFVDLYRDADWQEITWTYNASSEFSPLSRIDIIVEMILVVWLILEIMKFWKGCKC